MAQIRDLANSLRRTGTLPPGTRLPARILEKARLGQLSARELSDLKQLLRAPELADQFTPELRSSLETFVRGSTTPVKPVTDLVPDLARLQEPQDVPQRFASDYLVLRDQLLSGNLPEDKQADRAFEFFGRYAERFVALANGEQKSGAESKLEQPLSEQDPEALVDGAPDVAPVVEEATRSSRSSLSEGELAAEAAAEEAGEEASSAGRGEVLRSKGEVDGQRPLSREEQLREAKKFAILADGLGFRELADKRTGKSGTELVYELAQAQTLRELRQQLSQVNMKPNPSRTGEDPPPPPPRETQIEQHPTAPASRQVRELGEAAAGQERRVELERVQNRPEAMRVQPWLTEAGKVLVAPLDRSQRSLDGDQQGASQRGFTDKRLGRNMVWNLLHRFRGREQDESALNRDVWDKIAVGAILFLFGLAILVIVLVSM